MLPKVKEIKLIDKKRFLKNAKKVKESLEEEQKYLEEKRKYENSIFARFSY